MSNQKIVTIDLMNNEIVSVSGLAPTNSPIFTGNVNASTADAVLLPNQTTIGNVLPVEISYLSGVTSNIQAQISNLNFNDFYSILEPELLMTGQITRNSNGVITSAPVLWSNGDTGTFTATEFDSVTNGINSYQVTKGSITYIQPAITRDSNGFVINRPAIVVQ